MTEKRVLVAGIGNIFLGDDGFGVEVVSRLLHERLPDHVDVVDYGIRGMHLAYELSGGRYDAAILVDTASRGEAPGTLYVIEPDAATAVDMGAADGHSLTPEAVLAWLQRIGGQPARITIVGCEPSSLEESIGLSAPVAAAVDGAMRLVREILAEMSDPSGRNGRSAGESGATDRSGTAPVSRH